MPLILYIRGKIGPTLDLNFASEFYRNRSVLSTFDNSLTYTGASAKTMVDSDGLVKWAPHNLALNSAAPVTQNITVISGVAYTVECTGTGSITLSGAGIGSASLGVPVEITAATTTLTLTIVGSVDTMWAYRSDLGGMVNNSDRGDSYVPTTSAAVYLPRRGHHIYDGSTWVNKGILLESEARTNLLAESNDFGTTWTANNASLTAADATGPDGASSMTLLNDSSATGTGEVYVDYAVTVSTAVAYTFSVFVKADQLAFVALGTESFTTPASGETFFNLTTGALATVATGHTATIENCGGGIYRCAITFTTDAADTAGNLRIYVAEADTDITVDLDGTSSVHIFGAQLELGSTASSYIPTAGATVTRAAETLTVAAANLPYSATNMSIQMDGEMTYADEAAAAQLTLTRWYADASNYIILDVDTDTTATGEINANQNAAATLDTVVATAEYTPGVNVAFNIASRHTSGAINIAKDGTAATANTTPTALPDLSATNLELGYDYMGTIGQFRMWDADLGDTGIAEASARTYTTEFAMIVSTTTASETFTIPCQNVGTFNAVIDWGDNSDHSTITAYNDADLVHVYNNPGDHVIRITGTFPNIYFNNAGDRLKVKSVENFGKVGWTRADGAFHGCSNMTSFTSGTTDTSSVTSMYFMFYGCTGLTTLDLSSFDTSSVTTMYAMFYNCSGLTTLDVSSFNTSSVTTMAFMFRGCSGLTTLDLSGFSTASVTAMRYMFYNCSGLTTLNVSGFDTSSVTTMNSMFYSCSELTTLDVSSFNTSSVTDMYFMFYSCSELTTLDLSGFNTALVTDMYAMFYNCSGLTTLDVSSFNTSSVTDIRFMFNGCSGVTTLDVSSFDTSSVTSMYFMFYNCSSLTTLDVSSFDTSSVTSMGFMFFSCSGLTDIIGVDAFDISGLNDVTSLTNFANGVTLPTSRYDALLIAWEAQDPFDGMAPNFGSSTYTGGGAVAAARASLISRDGWTITDGGVA
jgi:surface protein